MKMKLITILAIVALSSCTHKLEITNFHENRVLPSSNLSGGAKTIGIASEDQSYQNQQYIKAIVNSLRSSNNFDQVIYPYSASTSKKVDYIINLTVSPEYTGRTSNFFVNWPGFLVFCPAIIGYGYNAKIITDLNVTNTKNNKSQIASITNSYAFRQAEMDRTWTQIGWLEVGITPLIGGFFFTKYDTDVTDEFIIKVSDNYGSGVARGLIEAIKAVE